MKDLMLALPKRFLKMHPATLLALSFLAAIALGTFLLMLPVSARSGATRFLDALFTATSAICVTGLVVVDTGGHFTRFGQLVILVLIQVGGLGIMTFSVLLFRLMGRTVTFRQRMIMQDVFAHTQRGDIFALLKSIFLFTGIVEGIGALLLFLRWFGEMGPGKALYNALFHSVSAFCNAGFSLHADNLTAWQDSACVNVTVCLLIIIGGIGFPVLHDLRFKLGRHQGRRPRLALQTKTVLAATALLIAGGAAMFFFLENNNVLAGNSLSTRLLASVFQSVTCRTAGFNTVDIKACTDATLAMMILLMFVGASPGSCGGGIKTTTLALIAAFTWSKIVHRSRVNLFKKSVPQETMARSGSLLLLAMGVVIFVLFMILLGNTVSGQIQKAPPNRFLAYLFETVSAFGTVGLSMGITPDLGSWGKAWITVLMYIGRVGVLTFAYIIVGHGPATGIEYSEENIMIG